MHPSPTDVHPPPHARHDHAQPHTLRNAATAIATEVAHPERPAAIGPQEMRGTPQPHTQTRPETRTHPQSCP